MVIICGWWKGGGGHGEGAGVDEVMSGVGKAVLV